MWNKVVLATSLIAPCVALADVRCTTEVTSDVTAETHCKFEDSDLAEKQAAEKAWLDKYGKPASICASVANRRWTDLRKETFFRIVYQVGMSGSQASNQCFITCVEVVSKCLETTDPQICLDTVAVSAAPKRMNMTGGC